MGGFIASSISARRNSADITTTAISTAAGVIADYKSERPEAPTDKILPTKSLQTILTSACKHLKISHLSHHDLRHIFATRCIEIVKEISLVASWLGHKDGGRTALLVYGHIRQTHSAEHAQTVDFLAVPINQLEQAPLATQVG